MTAIDRSKLEPLASALDVLIDDKCGVIEFLEEVRKEAGGPDFFHYKAKSGNVSAFRPLKNFRDGGGASVHREIAIMKAAGEAIERYCSAIYDIDELPLTSYDDAPFACTAPEEYALFTPAQYAAEGFPWVPFTNRTKVRWTPAVDLGTGEAVHVPACRVYMPYMFYVGTQDAPIDQPISTGMACHGTMLDAQISGICEAIERDAVLLTWQAMMSPRNILIESLDDENYDIVRRLEVTGAKVQLFDITMDHGVPTVLSVLRGTSARMPAMVVAASAALSPREAVCKALEELAHTRRYCNYILHNAPRLVPDPPDFLSVTDQITHLNFYVDHANAHAADFLFASEEWIEFDDMADLSTGTPAEDLRVLVERITGVGERVLIADMTTPDIRDLGLSVIRAVVPGFQPLHMGYRLRSLGGRRLREVPPKFGFKGIGPDDADNPFPHPYP